MTGFGSATTETATRRISIEVRSVNHRYLKVSLRLPRTLSALEPEFEAAIQKSVRRGAVSVTMAFSDSAPSAEPVLDLEALQRHQVLVESVRATLRLPAPPGVDPLALLVALPGAIRSPSDNLESRLPPAVAAEAHATLKAALESLLSSRAREGAGLARVLLDLGEALDRSFAIVRARAPAIPVEQRDRMRTRVTTLLQGMDSKATLAEPDLLRELCLLSDRADIAEEIARFDAHLAHFRDLLREGGELGRRLDFLLQEMLRETNTIGSKANDAAIAHAVVSMKCDVERMKEQVQNLE